MASINYFNAPRFNPSIGDLHSMGMQGTLNNTQRVQDNWQRFLQNKLARDQLDMQGKQLRFQKELGWGQIGSSMFNSLFGQGGTGTALIGASLMKNPFNDGGDPFAGLSDNDFSVEPIQNSQPLQGKANPELQNQLQLAMKGAFMI